MRGLIIGLLMLLTLQRNVVVVVDGEVYNKISGIIIPGFASTQLRAWSFLDCPYSPLDFHPLDLVWLDTTKLLSAVNCWLKCIMLEPYNQTDHPECKSRPDSGLSAITELDPGYITGPLSSVWKEWVKWCVEFGIEPNAIIAVPYDWRLSPSKLEERDLYFHKLKYLLSAVNCWLKCIMLEPYNQTDHPECKSRPDSGLSAITELDPGYITGPLSSVWKEWVKWCVEFGIEPNAIIAVPYDWRLSPSKLEERDLYFHKLKLTFETAYKLRGGPSIVYAHSLGNLVFRYFLEWLKLEIAPKEYMKWLDQHIHAYFAVGSPFLGATETVKAALLGCTFGIPVSEGTARLMFNSFGSSMWMLPLSKYCKTDNKYSTHFSEKGQEVEHVYHCEEEEFKGNYSGWPTKLINIEIPSYHSLDAYPSVLDAVENASMECSLPTQLSFTAREIADGTLFKAIKDYDPDSRRLLHQLQKSYLGDPVANPLTPWDRPPIKNVFCIYGIDSKTEVGYYVAPSGKPYPDNWIITDIIYELEGSLYLRSGNLFEGNPGATSGDETVSYNSLSWCKNWLGSKVNITRTPQAEHDGTDVQIELGVVHEHGTDIVPNMTRSPRVKYITYYEDSESIPGRRTAVWEMDKVNHRNMVRSPALMRELWLEVWHDTHPSAKSKFVTKEKRGPLRDDDCYWDYGKARCAWPEYCEYRYAFGDVHLGQSCRLRNSLAVLLLHYI